VSHRATGSTGTGSIEWLWQRLTAIYLGAFGILLVVELLAHPVQDFADWQRLFSLLLFRILWLLAFLALFVHAWIGIRNVYMDYLHRFWLRFLANVVTAMFLLTCGVWLLLVLLGDGV
jgi:succinate dehydrogenase / fumarate reductase membrane anchor subunit